MNVEAALLSSMETLERAGVPDFRRDAFLLLGDTLGRDQTFLIAHPEYELTAAEGERFSSAIDRRRRREPVQYITGHREFFGLDFIVTPDVLIPRPETEMLVERALEIIKEREIKEFFEIGIGSGCISVSILNAAPAVRAAAGDISPAALSIAARNAGQHGVADRLELFESDVFDNISKGDRPLIVANPPYVAAFEMPDLQPEVVGFEPRYALTDEADGLSVIRRIAAESVDRLSAGGFLLMEIGCGQAPAVADMFRSPEWRQVDVLPDFQNIPRLVQARRSE